MAGTLESQDGAAVVEPVDRGRARRLENGVIVQAEGSGVEFAVVERAVTGFAPKRLEGLAKAR
jgi:hypothetical protein